MQSGKDDKKGPDEDRGGKHKIFVNETEYEVREQHLTGAQIKALASVAAEYQLFLEQPGDDRQITDTESVKIHSNMKFYALPPATFG